MQGAFNDFKNLGFSYESYVSQKYIHESLATQPNTPFSSSYDPDRMKASL
jgi:hypothetical protein